jgi:hypothetical protein
MSGDVFGNGMLLSPQIRLSPPSTTATSSSIPIPIRRAFAERQAAVRSAALELAGL